MKVDRVKLRRWGRWAGTFVGFPLAGVAARLAVGNVDTSRAAVIGGLVGGVVLGATQAIIGGIERGSRLRWIGATGAGLGVGLGVGAAAVGYRTDATSLVVMGAICGAAVGSAQALAVPLVPVDRLLWAVATPVLWAGGWLITAGVIVDADRQHAVFGASGAVVVSVLAGLLYARWRVPARTALSAAPGSSDRLAA
ncbi:MAG TPA: hypothetical protein VIY72_13140 [Acidimicrobiales bacterium]